MEKTVKRINNKEFFYPLALCRLAKIVPRHEISNYMVCVTSKASDQPVGWLKLSRDMRFPTICYERPAKPQVSRRICAA